MVMIIVMAIFIKAIMVSTITKGLVQQPSFYMASLYRRVRASSIAGSASLRGWKYLVLLAHIRFDHRKGC